MIHGVWGWVLYVVILTEGIVLIVAALLERAGIRSFIRPRGGFKHLSERTTILLGAGLAVTSITSMIPHRESTYVLLGCLSLVALGLAIASFLAWMRQKPVET